MIDKKESTRSFISIFTVWFPIFKKNQWLSESDLNWTQFRLASKYNLVKLKAAETFILFGSSFIGLAIAV